MNAPSWPDELVEMLRMLHARGLSFSRIAAQIGMSRDACIGKAKRLGLSRHGDPPAAQRRKLSPFFKPDEKREPPPEPTPMIVPAPALIDGKPVTLLTVQNGQCRFPLWPDNAPCGIAQVCGHSASGPWCEYHKSVVFPPTHKRAGRKTADFTTWDTAA